MGMLKRLAISSVVALSACTTVTDVVRTGPDSYMVGASDRIGWRADSTLRAMSITKANEHCISQGKIVKVEETVSKGVFMILPTSASVSFRCVAEEK